jgi:hypothetical protein
VEGLSSNSMLRSGFSILHPRWRWTLAVLAIGACQSDDDVWRVTPTGIGRLRAGMTVTEARSTLPNGLADPTRAECDHVAIEGAPGRILAMIVQGRVARIEVQDSATATDVGARVGDTEQRIDSLYSGRVAIMPHKYVDGHYLVVTPTASADSMFRLVFETDGARVTRYRVGLLPAVEWVEGCS